MLGPKDRIRALGGFRSLGIHRISLFPAAGFRSSTTLHLILRLEMEPPLIASCLDQDVDGDGGEHDQPSGERADAGRLVEREPNPKADDRSGVGSCR
jgi:hypothetical protein